MRAPFQVIVFPYRVANESLEVLIGKRSDGDYWQAISGGGENLESPQDAAIRELHEEAGLNGREWVKLDSMCTLPRVYYSGNEKWGENIYVIPEYAFMVRTDGDPKIPQEHSRLEWHSLNSANTLLKYDSNRNALWELCQRVNP